MPLSAIPVNKARSGIPAPPRVSCEAATAKMSRTGRCPGGLPRVAVGEGVVAHDSLPPGATGAKQVGGSSQDGGAGGTSLAREDLAVGEPGMVVAMEWT